MTQSVHEFVAEYEFRGDTDYAPNDHEKALIEDALHGFLATKEEEHNDKIEGLQADLEDAVAVAFKRGAVRWTFYNYPKQYSSMVSALSAVSSDVSEVDSLLEAYFEASYNQGFEGRKKDNEAGEVDVTLQMIRLHVGNLIAERDLYRSKVSARALSDKALGEDLAAMEAIVKSVNDEENVGRFPEWVDERMDEIIHEQKRRKMEAELVAHTRAAPKPKS